MYVVTFTRLFLKFITLDTGIGNFIDRVVVLMSQRNKSDSCIHLHIM